MSRDRGGDLKRLTLNPHPFKNQKGAAPKSG
jgi:hypothetical protein